MSGTITRDVSQTVLVERKAICDVPITPAKRIKNWYNDVVRSRIVIPRASRSNLKKIPTVPGVEYMETTDAKTRIEGLPGTPCPCWTTLLESVTAYYSPETASTNVDSH